MSLFEVIKETWNAIDGARDASDAGSPFMERIGDGTTAVGGALTALGPVLGVPALTAAGPFLAAGGMGLQIGSFADQHLGLSDKMSDAMVGDSDERTWEQGIAPVHFRGAAGSAEADLLNIGRQQSFLKNETARQVDIAKWAKKAGEMGSFNAMPKSILRGAYDIDIDEDKKRKEMMGLFGHLTQ